MLQQQSLLPSDRDIDYNKSLHQINLYWLRRSTLRWAADGDLNTTFFHATVNSRRCRNTIYMLLLDDNKWTICLKKIREAFIHHFQSIYCESESAQIAWPNGLELYVHNFLPQIEEPILMGLEAPPSSQEIEKVVFELGPDKALGSDGINARFIQSNWMDLKPCIEREVSNFFSTANLPTSISKSNMVLIPKKDNPMRVIDYRPISICNVIYKIISKILTNRLKPLIPSLVFPNQVAFTPGRDISDQVILMREILHSFSQSSFREKAFCLKSNLSKAFDRMSWSFVEKALLVQSLPPNFVKRIMACVRSACFTILFQGSGEGFTSPVCGLRLGCALSPYIFILCMNVLTAMLQKELTQNIRGLRLARQ